MAVEENNEIHKVYYNRMDVVKFILSICVAAFHTWLLRSDMAFTSSYLFKYSCDLVVPFFFIAMGYLTLKNVDLKSAAAVEEKILITAVRFLKMYIFGTVVFLPVTVWDLMRSKIGWFKAAMVFIRNVIFMGENQYSWPLWFLLSAAYAMFFLYFLIRILHLKQKGILISWVFVLLWCLLIEYIGVIPSEAFILQGFRFIFPGSKIFGGTLFVPMGVLLIKSRANMEAFMSKKISNVMLLGLVLNFLAAGILRPRLRLLLVPFGVIPVFIWCLKPYRVSPSCCKFMRLSSVIIYATHMFWYVLYTALVYHEIGHSGIDVFLVSLAGSLLCSVLIFFWNGKKQSARQMPAVSDHTDQEKA